MATYQSDAISHNAPARLVSIGLTPKYEEFDPATLDAADVFECFLVPNGVRVWDAFITAVGGTGLDVNGTPTLTVKLEVVDDNGTTLLISTSSGVRAAAASVKQDKNVGYLVESANNDALVKLTVVAASATLGTSNLGVGASWSSYTDD